MKTLYFLNKQITAQFVAAVTVLSLLLSALPAAFFVAEAAPVDLYGPSNATVTEAAPFNSGAIDASGHQDLELTFKYDASELAGSIADYGIIPDESFTYGWKSGTTTHDLGTIEGFFFGIDPFNLSKGTITVNLPPEAEVADLEIYITVDSTDSSSWIYVDKDRVKVKNLTVTGEIIPEPCPDGYTGVSPNCVPPTVSACDATTEIVTTNLSTWDLSQSSTDGSALNEITADGLHILTQATGHRKAAGYYGTDFPLSELGDQTVDEALDYVATSGIEPGLQLVIDFDNNGTIDGILVGEKTYEATLSNSWWLTNSAAQFVKDAAPNTGGGHGSNWFGTPDGWLSKFPNAQVKAIGYSLGSGITADGVIKSINLGCVTYTFELPVASLTITNPVADGDIVPAGPYNFTAEYIDDDTTVDTMQWAIRAGTCEPNTNTVFGNVDGHSDVGTLSATTFTANVDVSSLTPGEDYCFVVNPQEQSGENDLRATRWFTIEPAATINFTKIICEDESLLPNDGYNTITETTAAEFLASTEARAAGCELAPDWEFEWAINGQDVFVDNQGEQGSPWTLTNGTDANGTTAISIPASELGNGKTISVREVWNAAYIPFTGRNTNNNVSAELYCTGDALNYDNLEWIPNVTAGNSYHCVAWNVPVEPPSADVTMCKLNEEGDGLAGWQLALLGGKIGEVSAPGNGDVVSIANVPAGDYVVKASGTYKYRTDAVSIADARFSQRRPGEETTAPYAPWRIGNLGGLHINGFTPSVTNIAWGNVFSPSHIYYAPLSLATTGSVDFKVGDDQYSDNSGSLTAELFAGYTGITDGEGCVTFSDVPYGTYNADEVMQDGWQLVSGVGEVVVDGEQETFNIINRDIREVPVATIIAEKVVCEDESLLPNWNDNGSAQNITETTAADWVAQSNGGCQIVPDWEFEWATENVADPSDTATGTAGVAWTTFTGTALLTPDDIDGDSHIWVREVLKDGYIPFTHQSAPDNGNNVTAEMYCHTDGLNYDNWDRVDGIETGETYHCVAFNAEIEEPAPMCTVEITSSEETLVVDTNNFASSTYDGHPSWTGIIPDAIWVWASHFVDEIDDPEEESTYTFKETFTVIDPTEATLVINADNWYKIIVNGNEVINRTENSYQSFQQKTWTTEIQNALVSGQNTIEFVVTNQAMDGGTKLTNPAGLLFKLTVKGSGDSCDVTTEPEPETPEKVIEEINITGDTSAGENLPGWMFNRDPLTTTPFVFNNDVASLGDGALHVPPISANPSDKFIGEYFPGVGTATALPVADFLSFSYDFYIGNGGEAADADQFYLNVYATKDDSTFYYDCRFDYVPSTGAVGSFTSVTFDATDTPTEVTKRGSSTLASCPATLAEMPAGSHIRAFALTLGDSNANDAGLDGYFDKVVLDTMSKKTTFDFEPELTPIACPYNEELAADDEECVAPQPVCEENEVLVDNECTPTSPEPEVEGDSTSKKSGGTKVKKTLAPTPLVLGASTTECSMYLSDYMKKGIENDEWEVKKLQLFLNIVQGNNIPVTGVFDDATDEAVRAFQLKYQSEVLTPWFTAGFVPHNNPTGWLYQLTRWKINNIVCPGSEAMPTLLP